MSDQDQLDFANGEDRVLVSFDSDVLVLHQSGSTHRGIAWCPANKYSIGELIQMLVLMHAVIAPAEMINRVEHL